MAGDDHLDGFEQVLYKKKTMSIALVLFGIYALIAGVSMAYS